MTITRRELFLIAKDFGDRDCNASEVMEVIRHNKVIPMSWGFNRATALISGETNSCHGFAFKVNGKLHKGWVLITVNFMDYYDITLTPSTIKEGYRNRENFSKTAENVFVGDLVRILDSLIETP